MAISTARMRRTECAARMTGSEDCSADHGNSTEASRALRLSGRVAASRAPRALSEGGRSKRKRMGGLSKLTTITANEECKERGESRRAGWWHRARITRPWDPSAACVQEQSAVAHTGHIHHSVSQALHTPRRR